MLSRYPIATKDDLTNATHEVMQQITLAGLYRGGFLDKAGKERIEKTNIEAVKPVFEKSTGNGNLEYGIFFAVS